MLKIPVGQKRLTNIAVVRLKSHGKRFEIACYKNKVLNWREGVEKDLNEVIQVDTIYTNVEKGDIAKKQDLLKAFGTNDREEICRKILKSGELQVSDKEREVHVEGLFRDIVQIVVERCVHPQTGRQLTPLTVENALKTVGFSVQPEHTAKKQSLKAIEALCSSLPESFRRAKMRLRITCPRAHLEAIKEKLTSEYSALVEDETHNAETGNSGITFQCEPSHYRQLDRLATATYRDEGVALQIVTANVLCDEGDLLGGGAVLSLGNTSVAATAAPEGAVAAKAEPAPLAAKAEPRQASTGGGEAKPKGMRCSQCNVVFEDALGYRSHCKSEWHNFNLKRKVKGLAPVTDEEFAEISLDTREGFLAVES